MCISHIFNKTVYRPHFSYFICFSLWQAFSFSWIHSECSSICRRVDRYAEFPTWKQLLRPRRKKTQRLSFHPSSFQSSTVETDWQPHFSRDCIWTSNLRFTEYCQSHTRDEISVNFSEKHILRKTVQLKTILNSNISDTILGFRK